MPPHARPRWCLQATALAAALAGVIGQYESAMQQLVSYVEANAPSAGRLWGGIMLDEETNWASICPICLPQLVVGTGDDIDRWGQLGLMTRW